MLLQVPQKQSSTKEAKVAPAALSKSIYQSNYEAPIETSQQEVEDGADDVFDMLLQVPEKQSSTKEAKVAPMDKAASIYQSNYEAPIETSQQEVEDGADDVFDMLLQVPQKEENSRRGHSSRRPMLSRSKHLVLPRWSDYRESSNSFRPHGSTRRTLRVIMMKTH